ncbi:MAG: trehalose-phosphatase [Dehalococcoidales bacterium]|nr:trehalose-phosphatase [Dehalococcoidales bacterium]
MEHLFNAWEPFSAACRAADHVLLLADYDGTLTPIFQRPEDAILSESMRSRMILLAGVPGFSLGVISGRELTEVQSLVAIGGIYYSGNHGLEMDGPGFSYLNSEAQRVTPLIHELAGKLADALKEIDGIILQDKDLSLSVHYRLVKPEQEEAVAEVVRKLTAAPVERGDIRVFMGKKVWEIRPPVDWDKGNAVETIRREIETSCGTKRLLTIYLGDDTTDEDAFKVLRQPDGWSVFVGAERPASAAEYYLESPAEVEELFFRLAALE